MIDIMLDLETMGTGPDAAIIAIGAVEFNVLSKTIGEKFYNTIDLQSAVDSGGVIDPSTVIWWMQQNDAARNEFTRKGRKIRVALIDFSAWVTRIRGKNPVRMWGNGAAADNVWLRQAYSRAKIPCPWTFQGDRCYRTLKALHPNAPLPPDIPGAHIAVNDALWQAQHLTEIFHYDKTTNR